MFVQPLSTSRPLLLLGAALATLLLASPVQAQVITGGGGGGSAGTPDGGAGGGDIAVSVGNSGLDGDYGGGGGGAGQTGGAGGAGDMFSSTQASGGAGGTAGGGNGADGANGANGVLGSGGGGGGAHGYVGGTLPGTYVPGGNGGNGGSASDFDGGGGGAGGYGAVITGAGNGTLLVNLRGGNGGNGGASGQSGPFALGGNGGSGGIGLLFTAPGQKSVGINTGVSGGNGGIGGIATPDVFDQSKGGAGGTGLVGNDLAITIGASGMVAGGNGGARSANDTANFDNAGAGGAGIVGSGLTIVNGGAISGGLSGDGSTRANAITFTGGTNRLEVQAGSTITGQVAAFSAADTFALGGTVNGAFDLSQLGATGSGAQYQGFGTLEKSGSGTWTVSGAPGAVMAWSVTGGTLDLGATSQTASAFSLTGGELRNGTLSSSGTFDLQAGTVQAVLAGGGSVVKSGTGMVVLTGTNTYSGGTNLYGGTLSLGSSGALGSGTLAAYNGAIIDLQNGVNIANQLWFDNAQTINVGAGATGTYSGLISEIGDPAYIRKTGEGTLVLTNNSNSFGSGAIISGGTLRVTGNNVLGHGPITLDGGTLQAGAAGLSLASGSIFFTSAGGAIDTGAFNMTTSAMMGDSDVPTGTFTKRGSGTLTITGFAGNNTYATATNVAEGTLAAGAANIFSANSAYTVATGATLALDGFDQKIGSLAGAGTVTLGGAALTAGDNNTSTTFSGTLSGSGALVKSGTGVLTFTGDSSGYTGTTTVSGGKLLVGVAGSGALGGSMTVQSDGVLGGSGTFGSGAGSVITIASGGTLSPGNSIGTLTINGDLILEAGSVFAVEVDAAGASDLVVVTGTATLAGSVVHIGPDIGYKPFSSYRILTAGTGLEGAFDGVSSNFAFLTTDLVYDYLNYTVDLTLVRNDIDFAAKAASRNQRSVAGAIEGLGFGNAVYDAILTLPDDAALLQASFDQLSGEIHASAKGVLIEDSRFVRDAATARIRSAFGGIGAAALPVLAYGEGGVELAPAVTDRFAFWSQGFGSWGSVRDDGNAAAFDRSIGGLLMGADAAFGDAWRAGLLAGYSHTNFDLDGPTGSGSSDNYHLGLYGGGQWGAFGLRGGAAYSWNRLDIGRAVSLPGLGDSLTAKYNAGTAQLFGEAAYRMDTAVASFEHFANLAYVNLRTDGFDEHGGAAALHGRSTTTDATFSTLGVRAQTEIAFGSVGATARGMLGWRHAFGDVTPEASLAFAGGNAFTVAGVPIARDAIAIEAGLDFAVAPNATLGLSYAGQIASGATDNGFKVDLSVRF